MPWAAPAGPSSLVGALCLGLLSRAWCDPCVAIGVLLVVTEPMAATMALSKCLPELAGQLHGLPAPSGEDVRRWRLWSDDGHHRARALVEQVVAAQVPISLGTQAPRDLQVARARRSPAVELLCVHEHVPTSSFAPGFARHRVALHPGRSVPSPHRPTHQPL